ncbi:MAG: anthranilate synthase component I family protein [Microbacteriaceae bacterium]|jgi:anthranilate synthase component 1|nr:anthranilate synthase component I family protein [Microbacteriaceae bacterium]MCI1207109.1 anthranilate synthase component I family protein [Microbacteriaceae bacterium]
MDHPDPTQLAAARRAADEGYRRYPLSRELYADQRTPVELLRVLQQRSERCFLLESAEDARTWGRYTFLGCSPELEVTARDQVLTIHTPGQPDETRTIDHPVAVLQEILEAHRSPRVPELPPFTGGFVGHFAYDFLGYAEPTVQFRTPNPHGLGDLDLMLFPDVIAYDNFRQRIVLISNMDLTADLTTAAESATERLRHLAEALTADPAPRARGRMLTPLRNEFTEAEFGQVVETVKTHIREGDIFQAVVSTAQTAPFEGSLLDTYRVLRTQNPSPYMFYIRARDVEIAGASPETLVRLDDGVLRTFPLAGSRPRGATPAEDAALEAELRADPKELSEHNMLVDLGRNDLGRVSDYGSVKVEAHLQVLRYSYVMHLGSTVSGRLREDLGALDALQAVLPAGTLSGAPKVRACQIIDQVERSRRGVYGGAIGYLGFSGSLDTCIAIRLAYVADSTVIVRSGAGIVADSDPVTEYQESVNKAKAVVVALETAQKGIDDARLDR